MKKINNVATSTRKQPLYGRMFDHQNNGLAEIAKSLAEQIIGNYTANDVVILYGCVNSGASSGAGLAFSVSAGAVYYNGEIYQVAAFSGIFSGTNVIVGTINTTNYQAGEPSLCSDGSLQFVAQDNIFVLSQAASGSGTKDLTSFVVVKKEWYYVAPANATTASGTMQDLASYTTPNDGKTRVWMIFFKGYSTCTTSNGDGQGSQIYNVTTAAQLDYTEAYQDEASTTADQRIPFSCFYLGTLAPNTQIKARFNSLAGGTIVSKSNVFAMVQIA